MNKDTVCEVVGISKVELLKFSKKLKYTSKKGVEREYTLKEVEKIIKEIRKPFIVKTHSGNFQELIKYYGR